LLILQIDASLFPFSLCVAEAMTKDGTLPRWIVCLLTISSVVFPFSCLSAAALDGGEGGYLPRRG